MCKIKTENNVNVDVTITGIVLTPLTCAALINEIIKYLVYQKSQIPYPYNWLQTVINRKRKSSEANTSNVKSNLNVDRHYHVVLTAYETLEEIMRNIKVEFEKQGNIVKEISVLFGTTPYSSREVFTIKIPGVAMGHNELNHSSLISKSQHKILRNIFFSQDWLSAVKQTVPSTNMYVMLKKQSEADNSNENNFFLPSKQFSVPSNALNVVINFQCDYENKYSCCDNLSVFEDSPEEQVERGKNSLNASEEESNKSREEGHWYQAKLFFKGYKDCFVNKISASELF